MQDALSVAVLVRNEVLRRGLAVVLDSLSVVDSVRLCASAAEAAELRREGACDVLVVAAPDAGWLAAAPAPAEQQRTKLLVLMDRPVTRDFPAYAAMGADGFLAQDDLSAEALGDALLRCRDGDFPLPPTLARALLVHADTPRHPIRTRAANLTSRETEALTLLVKGLSNKQIARRLAISSHGAKRLVASIMLKLDSPNRTTAAINAIKAGIVEH
jgi:two-component system nitrate/nitrite response regulator NarL